MSDMQRAFQFLKELKENNNREWFAQHKAEYDWTKSAIEAVVNRMIAKIETFDKQVKGLEAKDCLFRIYRDTRFAHDKTPYKIYIGAYMAGMGGRKSLRSGYYLHLEPGGGSALSGGVWSPEPKLLKALRQAVHENIDEFEAILHKPSFEKLYPGLWGESLKTVPPAFPKDVPHANLLKCKHYVVNCQQEDEFFYKEGWEEKAAACFAEQKPFHDFLNYTVNEFYLG